MGLILLSIAYYFLHLYALQMSEIYVEDKKKDMLFVNFVDREEFIKSLNVIEENYIEEDDSDDWESIDDNPYYNDNLDMDQQSPEFWDNL